MSHEKRRCRRSDVNVSISLQEINDQYPSGYSNHKIDVSLINISKGGVAFTTKEALSLHSFYDTMIKLAGGEKFEAVIQVVRKENRGEPETTYGCEFIGLGKKEQFQIDVYQIVNDEEYLKEVSAQ